MRSSRSKTKRYEIRRNEFSFDKEIAIMRGTWRSFSSEAEYNNTSTTRSILLCCELAVHAYNDNPHKSLNGRVHEVDILIYYHLYYYSILLTISPLINLYHVIQNCYFLIASRINDQTRSYLWCRIRSCVKHNVLYYSAILVHKRLTGVTCGSPRVSTVTQIS